MTEVWVFTGARREPNMTPKLPGGVFSSRATAEGWIAKHCLSGLLSLYRVDIGAYDWAVEHGKFNPKKPHHYTPEFIGRFSGGDIHYHYEDGKPTFETSEPLD